MICSLELIRKISDKKKVTKTRDIAMYAVQFMKVELEKAKFVSILVDAANHIANRMVPVIVRYFLATTGIIFLQCSNFQFTWRNCRINT